MCRTHSGPNPTQPNREGGGLIAGDCWSRVSRARDYERRTKQRPGLAEKRRGKFVFKKNCFCLLCPKKNKTRLVCRKKNRSRSQKCLRKQIIMPQIFPASFPSRTNKHTWIQQRNLVFPEPFFPSFRNTTGGGDRKHSETAIGKYGK